MFTSSPCFFRALRPSRRLKRALLTLAVGASLHSATALAPEWWAARNVLVTGEMDDFAVLNQGQLKNLTRGAIDELNAKLSALGDGAGTELNNLLVQWRTSAGPGDDFVAINVGQLKKMGKMVRERLVWMGVSVPPLGTPASNDDDDHALANMGQAKAVFAFDIGDYLGGLGGAAADPDGDGLTNGQEFAIGTSPVRGDTDGDGMPDPWEKLHNLDPRRAADAGPAQGPVLRPDPPVAPDPATFFIDDGNGSYHLDEQAYNSALASYNAAMTDHAALLQAAALMDPEGDRLSNLREYLAGTNPRAHSTDGDIYSDYEELTYGSNPLLASSIPPVRVDLSQINYSLLRVATFRADHVAGGETVTLGGNSDTLFFTTVLTSAQVTVTTDTTHGLASVYVFAPMGSSGSYTTVTAGGGVTGTPCAIGAWPWRGTLALTLNPNVPIPPGPSPPSPPPPEYHLFTAVRTRSLVYIGAQTLSNPTEELPGGGGAYSVWEKPGPEPVPPPYTDDSFNGDADLAGNNEDPGDPRDEIGATANSDPVPAYPEEEGAYETIHYSGSPWRNIGPYDSPGNMVGSYRATNAYHPPDEATGGGSGGFNYGTATAKLESIPFGRGNIDSGWQGNGLLGVKAYGVTSTLTEGRASATLTYTDLDDDGKEKESTVQYNTQSASMDHIEVRLQTNKNVEPGREASQVFVLTKTTVVEGGDTITQFIASIRLTIISGMKSTVNEVLDGALPLGDVAMHYGIISMRSPPPQAGRVISYELFPIEVVSRDKFLAGSFYIPAGWDDFAMEFIGPGGENLGRYGSILGGGSTKVYGHVTDILSEADITSGGQPSNQKVWFVRGGTDPDSRKINFYTCFNSVGQARIKLYRNGTGPAAYTVTHDLIAAKDFADTIDYVDEWVKGTSFHWSVPPVVLALASEAADDPSAAGLSPTAIANSLVSGAILTTDANVLLGTNPATPTVGEPVGDVSILGSVAALQILPQDAIQPEMAPSLAPGTVYWFADGVLHPLTEGQVAVLSAQADTLVLAVPPPPPPPPSENGSGGSIDNLTRAALIPFFNVVNQVEGLGSVTVGLLDGVKSGLQDDWAFITLIGQLGVQAGTWAHEQALAEIQKWRTNPLTRALELKGIVDKICQDVVLAHLQALQELSTWDGFKNRAWQVWQKIKGGGQNTWALAKSGWQGIVDGFIKWADDFGERMITGSEKVHWDNAPWVKDQLLAEINSTTRQMCYTFGYTFGYLCEQVAVGALTAGTGKLAQVAAKGGVNLAANLAKRTSAAVVARGQWLKRLLAESGAGDAVLRAAYERGLVVFLVEPVGPTIKEVISEVIEKAFSKQGFNRSIYSWKHLQDDILQRPNLSKLIKQQGGEVVFQRRLSQLATILGDDFDEMAAKNFAKVADEIILVAKPDGTVDEFFEAFFRAFEGNPSLMVSADEGATFSKNALSAEGKATLKKFLTDPNAGRLWDIDVPAIVDNEPAIPHNYWVRGILAELSIYKRVYKQAGYLHAPTAPGYDFTGPMWVQIKSLKNPDGAIEAMKKAVNKLIAEAPTDKPLRLHILKKPGTSSAQLESSLGQYIQTTSAKDRFELVVDPFELYP